MTIAEQIYELVKALPQDQASKVLSFAEGIHAKHLNAHQDKGSDATVPWAELVYSLAGAWGEDFPTLEEIRTNLGQDISRESL